MKTRASIAAALAVLLLSAGIARAQNRAPWLHIQVLEEDGDGTKVNVNLPVSLVQVFADIAEQEIRKKVLQRRSHIDLGDHEVSIADVRRAWTELRNAGDADFVEVDDDDYVKISRAGDKIVIQFDEKNDSGNGRIEVPISVVDALLSGEAEELNIRAALDELIASADTAGQIVFVEDNRTTVRIWID